MKYKSAPLEVSNMSISPGIRPIEHTQSKNEQKKTSYSDQEEVYLSSYTN